jgi:UDPglucose 6-dehydrogenase
VISRIKSAVLSSPASVPVGIFGLSFKPHTDDVRNSLSLRVIDALTADGIAVRAYDPVANGEASQLRPDVDYFDDPYEAASGVGALAILTNWPEFKDLDYERIASVMTNPTIVDAQNLLADIDFELHRINYIGIGRPAVDGSDG